MKMMLICETDSEREAVSRVFDKMTRDGDDNYMDNGVMYYEDGCEEMMRTDDPVVYSRTGDCYTVYNFKTGKKTENVEGDLAGLANLPDEDFPIS